MVSIRLREVTADDLPHFFEHQCDLAACRMAAFTAREPSNRQAFDAHWARILADPGVVMRTVMVDADVAGHVSSFVQDGGRELTYWIARPRWGQGTATEALRQFLDEQPSRPLQARAAKDNVASIRVLLRRGFVACGAGRGFAEARGEEIDELVFRLGESARLEAT
ncbi:MAG: GNAT family N-acetyltransferase [Bacteriovorax sp.]|nr:GNAT family N-acetyltransferase [Rhizobacter sp.]